MTLARHRALALVLLVAFMTLACASTPAGKAYQSIAACNATEQGLVSAFGVTYQASKASDPALWVDRYDKAMAAHASYEKIRDAAVDAAKAGGETRVILASVNAALNEFTALLATFGVR